MKAKISTHLVLGFMFIIGSPNYSQNVFTDGDFSSTTVIAPYTTGVGPANSWFSWQNTGTDANASIVTGECNYQVINGGLNMWEVQLMQWGFPLVAGNYYRLTFDVKADTDRWFGVYLGEDGGSWTSILGYENYLQNAKNEWQTKIIDFNASGVFDYHKFSFEIGGYNTSMYFDNIKLTDLGPYPGVGILGTALNGWDVDLDMFTTDGITYTLSNWPLTLGEIKFRQNDSWAINWGGYEFPTGTSYRDGPDIPVNSSSNYNITFNRLTGEYSFVCVGNCHTGIGFRVTSSGTDSTWFSNVNMSTSDGVTYFLLGYAFENGEVSFLQNDSLNINWGGGSFPSGTAFPGGPGIPVNAGSYNVTFNLITGEFSFTIPTIGMRGSAFNGWSDYIEMQTTDGITYTLSDYTFDEGEVKFLQNDKWIVSWGGYTFPTGYGYQYAPGIFVPAGKYLVVFNRMTGEYTFKAIDCPNPGFRYTENIYIENSPGICGAYVFYPDVIAAPNCGGEGITISQTSGLPSGSLFPIGLTTNSFLLTNSAGKTAFSSFDIFVFDTEPPKIDNISIEPKILWPPNHKMIRVTINYKTFDNCSGNIKSQLAVESNEPATGKEGGKTLTDWEVLDEHHVLLRAERSETGSGREYTIFISCTDENWNTSYKQVIVSVPRHNKSIHEESNNDSIEIEDANEFMPLKVKVWPNPSALYFNLEVETFSHKRIELILSDIYGKLISIRNIPDNHSFRFGDELKPGIYFATIRQGYRIKTIKVVKK